MYGLITISTGKNCDYSCKSDGGCSVRYVGPPRAGPASGICFSPKYGGGSCSGTPPECRNCNQILNCGSSPDLRSSSVSPNLPKQCKTERGTNCVFPFIYKGFNYSKCATVENGDKTWCSTRTDTEGNHVDNFWGYCAQDCTAPQLKPRPNPPNPLGCKTEQGTNCVFPFIFKGFKYSVCTTVENGETPWCSTRTDTEGNYDDNFWGNCAQDCPSSSLTTTITTPGQVSYAEKRSIFLLSQSFYSLTYV